MTEELYRLALGALQRHLGQAGIDYSEADGDLLVSGHRLSLSFGFEGFASQAGQVIAPVEVQIHLDGDEGDRFRVGTLGIGPDRDQALASAVQEWHLLAAAPLLAALGAELSTRRRPPTRQLAGWDLFAGRVGVRGSMPGALQSDSSFYQALWQAIARIAARWEKPAGFQVRSIFVMASSQEGSSEVQAAVDGFVEPEANSILSQLPWPTGGEAYLYKQLFVLRSGEL